MLSALYVLDSFIDMTLFFFNYHQQPHEEGAVVLIVLMRELRFRGGRKPSPKPDNRQQRNCLSKFFIMLDNRQECIISTVLVLACQ